MSFVNTFVICLVFLFLLAVCEHYARAYFHKGAFKAKPFVDATTPKTPTTVKSFKEGIRRKNPVLNDNTFVFFDPDRNAYGVVFGEELEENRPIDFYKEVAEIREEFFKETAYFPTLTEAKRSIWRLAKERTISPKGFYLVKEDTTLEFVPALICIAS